MQNSNNQKVFFGEKKVEIGKILRTLCDWKGVNIVEAEVCPDHVHMLLEIPPKVGVSGFVGYLKGKNSLMLYERFPRFNSNTRAGNFGAVATMLTRLGKTQTESRRIYNSN